MISQGRAFSCKACGGSGQVVCGTACESCGGLGTISASLQEMQREKYQPRFVEGSASWNVTAFLVIVNVMVFVLTRETGGQGQSLFSLMVNSPYVMMTGQYWRFFTPMLLHGGFLHLAFNLAFMWQFCPQMERLYGPARFLALYVLAGTAGDVLSWYGNHGWAGIGASGALFGVATAYVGLHLRFGMFDARQMRVWSIYLLLFIVLGFASGAQLGGARIDNWAHLGGALAGLLFTFVVPRPRGSG